MDSHRRMALLFFILMIILAVTLERMLYASGETILIVKVKTTLLEAIEEGLDKQFTELGMFENHILENPKKEYEYCTILNANGKEIKNFIVENNKVLVTSDINSKIHHTILAKKGLNVDSLYSLWSKKLFDEGIFSCQALSIHISTPNDKVISCGEPNMFKAKYQKISPIYAGLSNEIKVESFIRYSWCTVLKNAPVGVIVIGEFALFAFLFVCFVYFLRRKVKQDITLIENRTNSIISLANLNYVYDSHEFYVDSRKLQIRSQSASLLLLFLKAPSYYVTKEEIISCLWRTEDVGLQDRVRRAISDLRKLFRDEEVRISVELSENGYCLIA